MSQIVQVCLNSTENDLVHTSVPELNKKMTQRITNLKTSSLWWDRLASVNLSVTSVPIINGILTSVRCPLTDAAPDSPG